MAELARVYKVRTVAKEDVENAFRLNGDLSGVLFDDHVAPYISSSFGVMVFCCHSTFYSYTALQFSSFLPLRPTHLGWFVTQASHCALRFQQPLKPGNYSQSNT